MLPHPVDVNRRRRHTAVHEAGHAVLSWLCAGELGGPCPNFESIAILTVEQFRAAELGDTTGFVHFLWPQRPSEAAGMVRLAGIAAEMQVFGRCIDPDGHFDPDGSSDVTQFWRTVGALASSRGEAALSRMADRIWRRTRALVSEPAAVAAIHALSAVLLERSHIGGFEATAIIVGAAIRPAIRAAHPHRRS